MLGDPSTGFLVGQSQTFPDGSVKYSEYRIGGTSLSCPLFAGVIAVTNQLARRRRWASSTRRSTPSPAPRRSATSTTAARSPTAWSASTTSTASTPRTALTTSLRTLDQTGTIYTRKGYDDVTGVGSPNGASFFTAVAGAQMRTH